MLQLAIVYVTSFTRLHITYHAYDSMGYFFNSIQARYSQMVCNIVTKPSFKHASATKCVTPLTRLYNNNQCSHDSL